ncbi:MAG: hypothetical protein IEMM0008_0938 [bacterium]|nr:MAG: hypothetical protein IEMM0008_0938 [bacterium]
MNKIATILLMLVLVLAGFNHSYGKKKTEVDFSSIYASKPIPGFDGVIGIAGINIGLGSDFYNGEAVALTLRLDFSFLFFTGKTEVFPGFQMDDFIMRIPLFVGLRLYFKLSDVVRPYIEAGPEASLDASARGGIEDRINFGGSGGGGINFMFSKVGYLGVNARYHLIKNEYFQLGLTIGGRF